MARRELISIVILIAAAISIVIFVAAAISIVIFVAAASTLIRVAAVPFLACMPPFPVSFDIVVINGCLIPGYALPRNAIRGLVVSVIFIAAASILIRVAVVPLLPSMPPFPVLVDVVPINGPTPGSALPRHAIRVFVVGDIVTVVFCSRCNYVIADHVLATGRNRCAAVFPPDLPGA